MIRADGSLDVAKAKACGALRFVRSMKVVDERGLNGKVVRKVYAKFINQLKALVLLGKLNGWYAPKRHEIHHNGNEDWILWQAARILGIKGQQAPRTVTGQRTVPSA